MDRVQGPRSCARFRGKALNVDATGPTVVAHPTGARLGEIVRTGPGSSSRVSGARLPLMRPSGQEPECRCNGTYRCRASNPRRVGGDRKNRAGFCVWRDATGGRTRRPCQACCATTHRLSTRLLTTPAHESWLRTYPRRVQTFRTSPPESDANCRIGRETQGGWMIGSRCCYGRGGFHVERDFGGYE